MRSKERAVVGAEDAATEHDVDVELLHAQPLDRRRGHRDDLVGLPIDDAPGDGHPRCRTEHERRELDEPVLLDPSVVHGLEHLSRPAEAEVRRHQLGQ